MTDKRAEKLLDGLGIAYEREPDWITQGRKADFYCSTRPRFWCEVKTLGKLEDQHTLADALTELDRRAAGMAGTPVRGQAIAYIDGRLTPGEAKTVMRLAKRAAARFAAGDAPDVVIALIPKDANPFSFVRFSISTKDHKKVEFHCCASARGKYGTPNGLVPEPHDQKIRLRFSSGTEKTLPAHQVVKWSDDFHVAVVIYPHDKPLKVLTATFTGPGNRLKNPERIREAVSDANNQLKNAVQYEPAPGVLLIFHDGLDVPDEVIIESALYGDLKYTGRKGTPNQGKLVLDGDGAWNRDKNRTTGAVVYVRNNGEPIVIHNYWARRPLPAGIFKCKEIAARRNGKFEEVDFSAKASRRAVDRLRRARFRARQRLRGVRGRLRKRE